MLVIESQGRADIKIHEWWIKNAKGTIRVQGTSSLIINKPTNVDPKTTLNISLHDGEIVIDQNCFIRNLSATVKQSSLRIGSSSRINSLSIVQNEPSTVTIGKQCLFGGGVKFMTSDSHSIISLDTGERINPPKDIVLGDRVWVASEAMILKGSTIAEGSIIGARAVVCGAIPSNVLAVGTPAKPVKHGVTWDYRLLEYEATTDSLSFPEAAEK